MTKNRFILRNVAIIACLAATAIFSGCKEDNPTDNPTDNPINPGTEQEANIVAFTFAGIDGTATIDKTAHTVTAKAKETVDLTALVAEFTLSLNATATVNGTAQVSKQTANDFSNPVTYRVTSDDGETKQDWTVSITKSSNSGDCETELTADMVRDGGTFPKCTYIVKGNLNINADKTLTFAPGSVIKFANSEYGTRGYLHGQFASIVAKGTQQEPIIFTSAKENKAMGDWAYVFFKNCNFEWCTFEYGGQSGGGFMVDDVCSMVKFTGTGSLKHCTIRESLGTGLDFFNGTFSALEYCTITNCGETVEGEYPMKSGKTILDTDIKRLEAMGQGNIFNTAKGVRIAGGVSETTVLKKINCPYLITGISMWNAAKLTIEPGVQIKIVAFDTGLSINGNQISVNDAVLVAQGTAADPIIISGMDNEPWGGIYFATNRGAGCLLEHCRITGGGYDYGSGSGIVMVPGYTDEGHKIVTVKNCYLANSQTCGINFSCLYGTCSHSGNTVENCAKGYHPCE